MMLDLSQGGCRISSAVSVSPGTVLEVRIHLPDQKAALDIALAAVRWKQGGEFGLEFLQTRKDVQERIGQIVRDLEEGPSA